jgi:hypothetical protein
LLIRAANLPGELDAAGQRKFTIALCVDVLVIPLLWLPSNLFFIAFLLSMLARIFSV